MLEDIGKLKIYLRSEGHCPIMLWKKIKDTKTRAGIALYCCSFLQVHSETLKY